MTITTNNYQIGVSATPSQNFHLTTPAVPDGTLQLYRGNVGVPIGNPVLEVASDGKVSSPSEPAWTSVALTVTSAGGTLTSANGTFRYRKIGRSVYFSAAINIVTNGTGSSAINASGLPFAAAVNTSVVGLEAAITGKVVAGQVVGSTFNFLRFYDSTYPGANGNTINLSGVYEATS